MAYWGPVGSSCASGADCIALVVYVGYGGVSPDYVES